MLMKPETMRLLDHWRNEVIEPIQGIEIRRDYNPCDDGTIELMWFVEYQKGDVDHIFKYIVSNLPDDISAINIKIDVVEQVELKKHLHL